MILHKDTKYNEKMDEEVIALCDSINALPGITTIESCCGHGCDAFRIWFKVDEGDQEGLFFLTRCVDARYWEYGYLWSIELSAGDEVGPTFPIHFMLNSGNIVGKLAYQQANSLLENMNYHINHEIFMTHFNLNLENFEIKKENCDCSLTK